MPLQRLEAQMSNPGLSSPASLAIDDDPTTVARSGMGTNNDLSVRVQSPSGTWDGFVAVTGSSDPAEQQSLAPCVTHRQPSPMTHVP